MVSFYYYKYWFVKYIFRSVNYTVGDVYPNLTDMKIYKNNYLKGRNVLRKKFLRKKFLRFITSKMLYSAEEIFAVEGFLVNFAELFFAIQENQPIFAELTLRLKGYNIIYEIID